jgi:D-3-phosphoglycerate dehydrogenase
MEVLGPFIPLAVRLGRVAARLADRVERVEIEHLGRIAERDTRLLTLSVLNGLLAGRTEEDVNLVNAPTLAEERGIQVSERREAVARDYADLVRVTVSDGREHVRVVGTTLGRRHRPHLLEAWGQRFDVQLEQHVTLLRYRDVPGMIGRVGTIFGERGINIVSAAVGRQSGEDNGAADGREAAMVITTDSPVPPDVLNEVVRGDGFVAGRTVTLQGL